MKINNLNKKTKRNILAVIGAIFVICSILFAETDEERKDIFSSYLSDVLDNQNIEILEESSIKDIDSNNINIDLNNIPKFSNKPYVVINNNKPFFKDENLVDKSYEKYSPLDDKGRCKVAMSCVGKDIMPKDKREAIGNIKPSGWQNVKYDNINGKYLYNRCHLIGYQLTAENDNKRNLITGTRYLNIEGMLPFENMVTDYIKETNNHVLYRVSPIFENDNLIASGVLMEAKSVEDNGKSIEFNVYCYNVQPGIEIDYLTGKSKIIKQ